MRADTVYDRRAPGQHWPPAGPNSSNEEWLVGQALAALTAVDRDAVRAVQPRPRELFPPRLVGARSEPTLFDVFSVTRLYPDAAGQRSGSYSGTSTPSLGVW